MKIMAIDVGFGHTKIVCINKAGKIIMKKIPTAVAIYEQNAFGDFSDETVWSFEGKKYLVGEDAMKDAIDSRSPEFMEKYIPLIIAYAIKIIDIRSGEFNVLSTGLSIRHWKTSYTNLKKRLSSFTVNGTSYKFKKIIITPQGQGILFDEGFENIGTAIVVDGGYFTLDAMSFRNGKIVADGAFASDFGVSKILELVGNEISILTGVDYSLQEVNEFMKDRYVAHTGEKISISKEVNSACDKYFTKLFPFISTKIKDQLSRSEKVVIGGGLAQILKNVPVTGKNFMSAKNIVLSKNAEFANARGYYIIAKATK